MSLRTQIQQAVQAGFAALDDVPERATYISIATPTYDATTGTITKPSIQYAVIPTVFTRYTQMEIDGDAVRAQDQKAIIASLDLSTTPTINDTIGKADGTVWSVINIVTDPAGAAWVLQIRKP